ncbi:DUF5979 domain-containing protein [Microbacterium sp. NPDC055910]|uniref:DUF5979 domain-containing protein n=1 Tax=Microbacterium sp. NPDC055910 TaxID=3345659 RepID=UPI0035DFAC28
MSSSPSSPLRSRGVRALLHRVLAALGVFGLALVSVVALPSAAHAAPNADITVSNITIAPAGEQATVGDTLTVSGEWDATTANPHAGDVFTIGLPPEFSFPQSVPFPLMGTDDSGAAVVWGNCLTDPATGTATCVLTDAVTEAPELVKGTWQFEVQAVRATTEEKVVFDLNGAPVSVDLPGGGGIDDGIDLPGEVSKSGVMNQNNWSMTWTVDIPGANLVAAGDEVAHLTDTLGAGHVLCTPTGLKVETVRGGTVVDVTSIATLDGEPGDAQFGLALAGPFDANVTYRVTYRTCTPGGQIDPAGTTYDNSAQIEGWGQAGIGIGEVASLPWQQSLTKSGNVQNGTARNSTIAWTVVIPGDQLVGKNGFTLTETLGAGHELCAGTISGIQITERYGPSSQLQRNITDLLTATTISSSAQAFQVRFDIAGDLEFRASDYRYILTYTTCVTSDELPEGGTAYANRVDVDGQATGTEATVPARSQGKSGRINTSAVTIDGVQHMPQTTLDWSVTIPGEMIEDLGGYLTLTDTLAASHTICPAGDPSAGLATRLNLRVEARDQIQNGGLATANLTGVTALSLDGNELTLDIKAVNLPIPTGTSDGFSREYQYVITYTTCTASGGMDAPGTRYDNAVSGSGIQFSTSTTQSNSGSGTGQGVTRGSVAIDKALAETPGAALIPRDATFTVHVKEIDPTGTVQNAYDLRVPLDGAPVSGLNARGTGWTVELTEPTFPTISGVVFGDPVFAEAPGVTVSADGKTAIATIAPRTNVSVVLTNEALLGSVSIVKALNGGAADLVDAGRTYRVTASIDTSTLGANVPAQPDRTLDLTVGEPVVLENLPIGATVTFTEARPTDDDTLTWSAPVFSPESVTVTPAHATEAASVTLTNTVERTVGTFSLVKTVTGDQADNPAVPDSVRVIATWTEEGALRAKTLTLPTDGTPVPFGANLLIGTVVKLTEVPLTDGSSIAWGAPVWTGTGVTVAGRSASVTIGRDADATVTLENHAATSTAGISLLKGIAGEAAGEVDPATEFPVIATWTGADGVEQSRELTINAVEPTELGVVLPAGTVVTITEQTRPGIDTVVWGSITISGDAVEDAGDGSATVTVSGQQNDVTLVTVVNEATWAPGTFSLAKSVAGVLLDDADVPDAVTVVATWVDGEGAQSAEISVPTDGTVAQFPRQLAYGTEVSLTEVALPESARFTWADAAWSGERVAVGDDGSVVVTIGAADVAEVSLVNTAVASLGSVTLTKSLTGDGASASTGTAFPVTLTWTDLLGEEQSRDIELVADQPVVVVDLPLGTEVRAEERRTGLADRVRWAGADWAADSENVTVSTEDGSAVAVFTVTGESAATAALTLTNDLAFDADLPMTGSQGIAVWTVAAAFAAILAGAALMWRRRRA